MKMKTKILAFVAACLAGAAVAEESYQYLYWMVDVTDQPEYAFSYATVKMDGETLNVYVGDEAAGTRFYANDIPTGTVAGDPEDGIYSRIGADDAYMGSTFLFELYSDQESLVAWKSVSGAALANYVAQSMTTGAGRPYMVTDVVPEPTSALLLMLGVAGLALRRRRA